MNSTTNTYGADLIKIANGQIPIDLVVKNAEIVRPQNHWNDTAASRLIESILIGLPIGSFYFYETEPGEPGWNVIEGNQRLYAIKCFFDNEFSLTGTSFLQNLGIQGKFEDLPRRYQRRIGETAVPCCLIEAATPQDIKFALIARIKHGN